MSSLIDPFFEAGITWSGDWTARAAAPEVDGPYRHLRRWGVCGEELWCYLLLPPQIPYLKRTLARQAR